MRVHTFFHLLSRTTSCSVYSKTLRPFSAVPSPFIRLFATSSSFRFIDFWTTLISDSTDEIHRRPLPNVRVVVPKSPEKSPLVVLLVSKKHESLFRARKDFVSNTIGKFFANPKELPDIDVLIGLVDNVPRISQAPTEALDQPVSLTSEADGISLAISRRVEIASDLWSVDETAESAARGYLQKDFITFSIGSKSDRVRFQMPLADIIPSDEIPSSLVAQRWSMQDATGKESKSFCLVKERFLNHQIVSMPKTRPQERALIVNYGRSAWRRMTPVRKVSSVIGNVISKFHNDDNPSEPLSASRELESTINEAVKVGEMEPQHIQVFAVVKPKPAKSKGRTDNWPLRGPTRRYLMEGFRLHKVLSGGGGWGHKEGLISLDPDTTYKTFEEEMPFESSSETSSSEGGPISLFKNVVEVGDEIAFYVVDSSVPVINLPPRGHFRPRNPLLYFGTLKDEAVNETRTHDTQDSSSPTSRPKSYCYFGMMSRKGMSFELESQQSESEMWSNRTKLDLPDVCCSMSLRPEERDLQIRLEAAERPLRIRKVGSDSLRSVELDVE